MATRPHTARDQCHELHEPVGTRSKATRHLQVVTSDLPQVPMTTAGGDSDSTYIPELQGRVRGWGRILELYWNLSGRGVIIAWSLNK